MLTGGNKNKYNKGKPVRCDCGQLIAYYKNGNLMIYCKKCKKQIPFTISEEPEPKSQSH